MPWTAPATINPGDSGSSTWMNTYVRDNMNYVLSGRALGYTLRDNNANYTTTSTTFVDIDATNLIQTLTINSGRALIMFQGAMFGTSGFTAFDFVVDGTRIGASGVDGLYVGPLMTGASAPFCVWAVKTGLSVGSHTFKPQWKNSAGTTVTLYSGSGVANTDALTQFFVVEI